MTTICSSVNNLDGGGVLIGDGGGDGRCRRRWTIKDFSLNNFALAGRLAIIIFVLFLASKESNVFALVGRLVIIIFVLFLASKESVFFVLISIII